MACKLHREVPGKPVGTFNDDRPNPIPGDAVEHGSEARTSRDRITPFYGGVVKPVIRSDRIAGRLCIGLDGNTLAFLAVFALPDVRRASWSHQTKKYRRSCPPM